MTACSCRCFCCFPVPQPYSPAAHMSDFIRYMICLLASLSINSASSLAFAALSSQYRFDFGILVGPIQALPPQPTNGSRATYVGADRTIDDVGTVVVR